MFLLVSVRHVGAHPGGHQHGVSIQISINLGKTFLPTSRIRNIPSGLNLGEGLCIYIYLLLSPSFQTLSIDRFWFLFWSSLNDVTLKTSNFSYMRLQKQHSSLMYWLKICKGWVKSQLRWAWNWLKRNVTSSNVLRIIIHWRSASRSVGLTQRILTPKEHGFHRALKYSIRQHKLDFNLSKSKQPLPIMTNSHLNFRYLTASANL